MKFYYNGVLVRTSKNHEYHFAVVTKDDKLVSCHGTREAAEKEYRRPIAERESSIQDELAAIKAINEGKTYVDRKICRSWQRIHFKGKDLFGNDRSKVETWEGYIADNKKSIENLKTRKIVELEQR